MLVIVGKRLINVELDDGQVYKASLIGFDERSDLAVIKIVPSDPLTPIEVSNSSSVQIGDQVIAIGNAFGLGKTFTSGIISATGRDYGNPYLQLIQTDAAINPGNSGGALINENGNLIANWSMDPGGSYLLYYSTYQGNQTISAIVGGDEETVYLETPLQSGDFNTWNFI